MEAKFCRPPGQAGHGAGRGLRPGLGGSAASEGRSGDVREGAGQMGTLVVTRKMTKVVK